MAHRPIVVFDLDGTLIETAPDLAATLNVLLDRRGRPPVTLNQVRHMVGHGAITVMRAGMAATGAPASDDELAGMLPEFIEYYGKNIARESRPFPGTVDALDRLEEAGWALAICTNKREDLARRLMEELDLSARFAAILGGNTLEVCKPDPLHLTETIRRAGGDAARAVMVGDSITDVSAARAARVPVIGVTFGYTDTPMAELAPDRTIDHYDELPAAVFALSSANTGA